jgi:hypothetical protein
MFCQVRFLPMVLDGVATVCPLRHKGSQPDLSTLSLKRDTRNRVAVRDGFPAPWACSMNLHHRWMTRLTIWNSYCAVSYTGILDELCWTEIMSSTAHSPSKDKNLRAGDDEASSLLKRDSGAAADQSSSTTQPSPQLHHLPWKIHKVQLRRQQYQSPHRNRLS